MKCFSFKSEGMGERSQFLRKTKWKMPCCVCGIGCCCMVNISRIPNILCGSQQNILFCLRKDKKQCDFQTIFVESEKRNRNLHYSCILIYIDQNAICTVLSSFFPSIFLLFQLQSAQVTLNKKRKKSQGIIELCSVGARTLLSFIYLLFVHLSF